MLILYYSIFWLVSALELLGVVALVIGSEERLESEITYFFVLSGSLNLTLSTSVTRDSANRFRLCNLCCITCIIQWRGTFVLV